MVLASSPLTADGVKQVISWKSGAGLSQLASKPLRVVPKDAELYSFQFTRRNYLPDSMLSRSHFSFAANLQLVTMGVKHADPHIARGRFKT